MDNLKDKLLDLARMHGAQYPTLADCASEEDAILIVDSDSGRMWVVTLRELKGR